MGIPNRLGQLYGLGVGQRRAGRVGVDSHRHLHRLENARISRTTNARKTQPRCDTLPGFFCLGCAGAGGFAHPEMTFDTFRKTLLSSKRRYVLV
jgi:hypothetical protein